MLWFEVLLSKPTEGTPIFPTRKMNLAKAAPQSRRYCGRMHPSLSMLYAMNPIFASQWRRLGLLSFLVMLGNDSGAYVAPLNLKCEFGQNPSGIESPNPRLSWQVASSTRNTEQQAYQVQVASSAAKLTSDSPDLWDTGQVMGGDTHHLEYRGRALASSQQVFWRVRIWNDETHCSGWSTNAIWTMGILRPPGASDRDGPPAGWRAIWICAPSASESLLLRRQFSLPEKPAQAVIHVSGLGHYDLRVNDHPASNQLLAPGWTDYRKTVLYDTLEVTDLLQAGQNVLALTLGNGMYHVERRNRFAKFAGSFGPLRAIAELEIRFADGRKEIISTDETWKIHPGGITYNSIYGGEDFDARLEPRGWQQAGFDDANWKSAVRVVRPEGELRGFEVASEPLGAIELRQPISNWELSNSPTAVYDLGQNASYIPRLRLSGPKGSTVRLVPAELVNPDGTLQRSSMGSTNRGISWWQYTKATDYPETWTPKFYYVGCRYLQAERYPVLPGAPLPQVESLEGLIVHSTATPVGEFECSNPLLNRIRELVRWAQRANMVSVLTDCPHREKLGWLEQYHLNGPSIRYEFDLTRMYTKGMNDMADAQTETGLVPNIAPEYTEFKGAFRASPEWGSALILVAWQQFQFGADTNLLRSHYLGMKRYFQHLDNSASNNIIWQGLGDWFDLGPKNSGTSQRTPPPVTATAFYYEDAKTLANIAAILQKPEESLAFSRKADEIRQAFNEKFYNKARSSYATGSQAANAIALVTGLVDPAHSNAVLHSLILDLEANQGQMTAGDIGFRSLLQALAQADRSDLVYQMINQDSRPGYGWMLKHGATSLTEAWDANPTTSHNHFMLGQITEWFYKDLCGITPDPSGPGFKKIIIRPQPVGDLAWARASYNSIQGKITSHWRKEKDGFTLKVSIPANTTATVYLPAKPGATIKEGRHLANQSEGVKFLNQSGDRAVFAIGSGDYEFSTE